METIFPLHKAPSVTLVGAGPGDPELITLKGMKALQSADVVLYDALVSPDILALIPSNIPKVCVGKRAGAHSYTQDDINELIVEMAFLYGHVVRLKGGDSFVFGRGGEELEFAASHGLRTSVVPGISSALSVPAAVNIPVTMRGISESFWVVTGTTMAGKISDDVLLAAKSSATVIILMGLNRISEIAAVFQQTGKANTPVAVIQNGTLDSQQSIIATIATIEEKIKINSVGGPAIIVVGEVVAFASGLNKLMEAARMQIEAYQ